MYIIEYVCFQQIMPIGQSIHLRHRALRAMACYLCDLASALLNPYCSKATQKQHCIQNHHTSCQRVHRPMTESLTSVQRLKFGNWVGSSGWSGAIKCDVHGALILLLDFMPRVCLLCPVILPLSMPPWRFLLADGLYVQHRPRAGNVRGRFAEY